MAEAKSVGYKLFQIKLGDGQESESFDAPCGLTSRGFSQSASTVETNVPDCADDDAPTWTARQVSTLSGEISGSGILDSADLDTWQDWFESGASKNVQIEIVKALADGGGKWAGAAVLTSFNIAAEQYGKSTIEVTIQSDGKMTWTDAAL